MNRKKLGFGIYLYQKIKLFGGYIATYNGGLALHISPKKAILIPYTQVNNERKKFSFMKTFHLNKLLITIETGAEYLFFTAIAHMLLRGYFFINGGQKENIENNLWLTDGDVLRVSLNCVVRFNLFILSFNFIKFLKEKVKIICLKKKRSSIT